MVRHSRPVAWLGGRRDRDRPLAAGLVRMRASSDEHDRPPPQRGDRNNGDHRADEVVRDEHVTGAQGHDPVRPLLARRSQYAYG